MYKYETHLHTSPVSRCARASAEESLIFYKEKGYDGVFITNHFIDGNINIDRSVFYEEKIDFYFSDYENAVPLGKKIGIKVFCGIEMSNHGTDFLVYGIGKNWFLKHPEIEKMRMSEKLSLLRDNGAFIIQAHPLREAAYIDHIRLYPRHIEGVEVINANRTDFENKMAEIYADSYNLLKVAGSDNHTGREQSILAGVMTETPLESEQDYIKAVRENKIQLFKVPND